MDPVYTGVNMGEKDGETGTHVVDEVQRDQERSDCHD